MSVPELLNKSKELTSWIDTSVHGVSISTSLRNSIAAACFDVVHEHRKAILLLVENKLIGSAFSLFRPEFETFVRGVWALRCASDKELSDYENDKVDSNLSELIAAIEALDPWNVGLLSNIKRTAWASMCSYAHGGGLQISRRFTKDAIASNYSDGSIVEVIHSTNFISLMAVCEIAAVANDPNLGKLANEKLAAYFPSQP